MICKLFCNALCAVLIEHTNRFKHDLYADLDAIGTKIFRCVKTGMIISRGSGIHRRKTRCGNACLREGSRVTRADVDGFVFNVITAVGASVVNELLNALMVLDRTGKVAVINRKRLKITEGIHSNYRRGNVLELLKMRLNVCL